MSSADPVRYSAAEVIRVLDLAPLEPEGGFYRETWQSRESLPSGRPLGTAILYLLIPDSFSALHRLPTDEIYHFYRGDPVTQLHLYPDGTSRIVTLGPRIDEGHRTQSVVPAGTWQGSFLAEGGEYALMGTTLSPGFLPGDYEAGIREVLVERYPDRKDLVSTLTR